MRIRWTWAFMGLFLGCEEVPSDDTGPLDSAVDTGSERASFEVTGWVFDREDKPVEDAMVLVGGQHDTLVYTDASGAFSLWYTETGYGQPAIVASKIGYRAKGFEFFEPDTPITIQIRQVNPPDNESYVYQDPGNGYDESEENCSHCHSGFVLDFLESKHADATQNPLLQDLYAGVTRRYLDAASCEDAGGRWATGLVPGTEGESEEKCYLSNGVLQDLNPQCGEASQPVCDDPDVTSLHAPDAFGACADCHAPGIDGVAGGRNLHDAVGLAYDIGVHCDTCHKVSDIDMSKPPGVGQRLVTQRPSEPGINTFVWDPVFFGPLIDVPNVVMGGSPQPKFNESVFCAGCHEQNQAALLPGESLNTEKWPDGLPIHATYQEWERGPYNQEKTQCQWCHMPADVEATNAVDVTTPKMESITFGFAREPEDIRQHLFRGPLQGDPRLIDTSVYTSIDLVREGDQLSVDVSVANIGCGHAIPTGEPMRSLLLYVDAEGEESCASVTPVDGLTIPDTGGARAVGIIGEDIIVDEEGWTWDEGARLAEAGHVVRVVRPTGDYWDYTGIVPFDTPALSPQEKGISIDTYVGEAIVEQVVASRVYTGQRVSVSEGDIVYLGDPAIVAEDDVEARYYAGRPGTAFSKVLLDASGTRHVPHYRAVDIASDNRIAPGTHMVSSYRFEIGAGCDRGTVEATVVYRPLPLSLADPRGWLASDYVISRAESEWGTQ